MHNQRSIFIDLVKSLLIILVVLGHFIQFFQYKSEFSLFWSSKLFKFIYTFHMPLFMAISGYFAYYSIAKYPTVDYIKSRLKYLLIPLLSWCLILSLIEVPHTTGSFVFHFLNTTVYSYWFVWAVIIYSILFCFLKKFKIDKIPVLIPLAVLILCIPSDYFRIDIGKDFFIYFAAGYVLANKKIETLHQFCRKYLLVFLAVFIICFLYWNPYRSFTNLYDLNGWSWYLFRVLLAIVASITIMEIMYWVYTKTIESKSVSYISKIGQETLGIYLMQNVFIVASWIWIIPYVSLPNISLTYLLPSVLLVIICYYLIKIISRNKIAGLLLFGKK
jgi:fucose 4-O-acetylase-like acetyltransferase